MRGYVSAGMCMGLFYSIILVTNLTARLKERSAKKSASSRNPYTSKDLPHAEESSETSEHFETENKSWPGVQLYVNDGALDPSSVASLRPTPLSTPISEVHRRYKEEGYVFLKGLLPRSDVLTAREKYFQLLSPSGVLAPNSSPIDGIFNSANEPPDYPGIGAGQTDENGGLDANGIPPGPNAKVAAHFISLALQAHTEPWYKDVFCKHPDLLSYISEMTGWGASTIAVRRTLLRNNTPGNNAIGVHYDQIFLRHGEDTAVTAWVPIGDITIDGGRLIYLENGHTLGIEIEKDFTAKAKESGMTDEEAKSAFNANMTPSGVLSEGPKAFADQFPGRKWLVTGYEAGDVILHTPYMIHASTVNHAKDGAIRLGTDLRFVDGSRPWDMRWGNVFRFGDGV